MSAFDYEKLAEGVKLLGQEPEPEDPKEALEAEKERISNILHRDREYLPLSHAKYQGIASAKGYKQGEEFSGSRLMRVHYSHEAMIDIIIAEPNITQGELAARFNRSQGWISIVMGSDAFQAALAKRRDDLLDPFLIATLEELS